MTAVKAADVDRAVAARGPDIGVLLFYGPDAGRVSERARVAAQKAVDDPADPFQLVRLDGDIVADHPEKLVEEATTFGMFGGRRAIWVRPTGRNIAPSVAACLDVALVDTVVVVEAGDLAKSAPLRTTCEGSPRALALPCYADEDRDLGTVVTDALRAHGLSIDPDARDLLVESLGGDRLATRSELDKLALYGHGQERITLEDVEAVVSDVSALSYDAVIDAAFSGDREALAAGLAQLGQHGANPGAVLAMALRHGVSLLTQRARLGGGTDYQGAAKNWRGLHFRRQRAAATQLRLWNETRLEEAIRRLQDASTETRKSAALGSAAAAQALFAVSARAGSGR